MVTRYAQKRLNDAARAMVRNVDLPLSERFKALLAAVEAFDHDAVTQAEAARMFANPSQWD